ncbi:hypothetical protein K438DRAFT_1964384 [Mycena galopus ATCC 62051]|nr:hypothetical protein K438DRAFT_1964384 [Mycena galopus ATCC 62051]
MGQGWKVINLDRWETYGWWGKLGEFLFGGSPSCLNESLRAPPTLPDCDSLIFLFKPGAICEEACEVLKRRATYFPQTATQSSRLLALPVETLQEIYSATEYMSDVVCLSMTCQLLWNIGRREIYDSVVGTASFSWAGSRIICVGDYLRNEDIPEGLLTQGEKEEFTGWDEEEDERYTLYEYPFREISRHRRSFSMENFVSEHLVPKRLLYRPQYYMSLRALVDIEYKTPAPIQPGALRNLSRRVYVREAALIAWREGTESDQAREVTFGHIVVSRISWSSDPSVSMAWDGDIHRGVWTGDRFDIVNSDWLEGLGDDDTAAAAVEVSIDTHVANHTYNGCARAPPRALSAADILSLSYITLTH